MRGEPDTRFESPIKYRISYSGHEELEKAGWKMWDKKNRTQVNLKLLKFIYLGARACVAGYDTLDETAYYSNVIANTKSDVLTVKGKKKGGAGTFIFMKGLYDDIKVECRRRGAKFTTIIYGWMIGSQSKEMVEIHISGSQLSSWMDLKNTINVEANFFICSDQHTFVPKVGAKAAHHKPEFYSTVCEDATLLEDAEKISLTVLKPFLMQLAGLAAEVAAAPEPGPSGGGDLPPRTPVNTANQANTPSDVDTAAAAALAESMDDDLPF